MRAISLVVMLFVALVLGVSGPAFCDDPVPTVLEDPAGSFDGFHSIINAIDPQAEGIWNLESNEWLTGFSGSLFNVKSNAIHLAALRAGYAMDKVPYGEFKVDLAGLGERFLPDKVKGFLVGAVPVPIRGVVRKYLSFGVMGGYDFETNTPVYGPTFGGRVKF